MKVSIIVPVYNVEKYLEKCLDSLVNQTLKDIEIIVINDGSPDNSDKIIDKFMKKYSNISYYEKENGGLSDARNYGIKYAKGDYISFIDSDDYVALDMYEKMYNKAVSEDFDFVACDINYVYHDHIDVVDCCIKEDTTDIKKLFIDMYPAIWNKLFKKSLFDSNLRFKKGVWYEDVEFIYRLLPSIKKVGVIHEPLNYYVQREESISHKVNDKVFDYIENMNSVVDYYLEHGFFDEYKKELEYAYVRYIYATFIKTVVNFPYDKYLKAVDEAIKNVHRRFPDYRHNKYFKQSKKGIYLLLFNKAIAKMFYKTRRK